MASETKIDEDEAAGMLRRGESVRLVAERFGVTTQAVYLAIQQGRLPRRVVDGGPLGDVISPERIPRSGDCAGSQRDSRR